MTQKQPRLKATWSTIGIAAILVAILPVFAAILAIFPPILASMPPVPSAVLPPVAAVPPEAIIWTVGAVWMWRPRGATADSRGGGCGGARGGRASGGRGAAVCAAIRGARAVAADQIPGNHTAGLARVAILALRRLVLQRPLVEAAVVLAQSHAHLLAVRCAADEVQARVSLQDDRSLVACVAARLKARIALEGDRTVLGEVKSGLLAAMISKAIHLNPSTYRFLYDSKVRHEVPGR